MYIIYGILSAIFAAIMAISIKIGLKDINPFLSLAIRTFIVLIFCFGLVIINGSFKEIKTINLKGFLFILLASVATFLTWLFYFLALDKGTVTKVLALDKLSIVVTLILGVLFLNEKITLGLVIGVLFLIAGSILIVIN